MSFIWLIILFLSNFTFNFLGIQSQLVALLLYSIICIKSFSFFWRTNLRLLILSGFLFLFLIVNLYKATINGVQIIEWLRESSSFIYFPISLLTLSSYSNRGLRVVWKSIVALGGLELIGIFVSSATNGLDGRATSLFGSTFISHSILICEFALLDRFKGNKLYQGVIISIFLFAYSLTGSRGLFFSSIILLLPHLANRRMLIILFLLILSAFLMPTADLPLFKRDYILSEDASSLGKFGEIEVMFNWFKENPFFGKGIGVWYNNGVDLSDFNYSHNMILFLLGYCGILFTLSYLFVFLKIGMNCQFRYLIISIVSFYLSATTYSTLSFTIFLSVLLVLSLRVKRSTNNKDLFGQQLIKN